MRSSGIKANRCYSDGYGQVRLVLAIGQQYLSDTDSAGVRYLIIADGTADGNSVGEMHDTSLDRFASWAYSETQANSPPLLPAIAYLDQMGNGLDEATPTLPRICGPFRSLLDAEKRVEVLRGIGCKHVTLYAETLTAKVIPFPITWEYVNNRRILTPNAAS